MNEQPQETMTIIVFPSGEIVTAVVEDDSAISVAQLLAPGDFNPVDAPIALLRMAISLLPESVTKFHAFKAYHTAKRERMALNDRMRATAEPTDDELPF